MALVLVVDTETTGLDPKLDYVIELGFVLYDTDEKRIIEYSNDLVLWPGRPEVLPKIRELTGISNSLLEKYGQNPIEVFEKLTRRAYLAKYVVGHNILKFDREMISHSIFRLSNDELNRRFYSWKYIDTMCDLPYPKNIEVRKLKYLAFEHGHIMSNAHQALDDAIATAMILSKYDFSIVEEAVNSPMVELVADVSYAEREKAKLNGFQWDKARGKWILTSRKYYLDEKKKQLNFNFSENELF